VPKKLNVSLVSEDQVFADELSNAVVRFADIVNVDCFNSHSSFLKSFPGSGTDIIMSDQRNTSKGWNNFFEEVMRIDKNVITVFIVEDKEPERSVAMIKAGAYDVLTTAGLTRLRPLFQRLQRYINEKANLRYLSDEKRFGDQIANSSRSMLSIINQNYEYEKVNETFCAAHNLGIDSVIGKPLWEIWGQETFESKIKKNIDQCFQGKTVRYEANFGTPMFGERYFDVVFRPISKDTNHVTHLLAETFDITDLKRSQHMVSEMEEEFKRLETNLPIGFLRCDISGSIIHANRAFLKIIECEDTASITGLGIREFYAEKGLLDIHLAQLIKSEIKTFGRVPLVTCKDNEIACRVSGYVVMNDSDKPAFIDFAFEDSSRELMLENRLLQAQKLETIGSLAGGLAHDFNNILATISGYSELLLEEIPKETQWAEQVSKILSAVAKAKSLTDQILTFSRHVDQEKISVSVAEVLSETLGFVRSAKPENIEIIDDITDKGVIVYADPTQLFRVFLNLITNAFQAMEDKGGSLFVKLSVIEGKIVRYDLDKSIVADEYALVTIEDTGEGMDQSVLDRIFEPYFTTREVGKGTGLGLSVVHGIVSELEGEILITSKKDKGSVFSIYLPVYSGYKAGVEKQAKNKLMFISGNKYESRILSLALRNSGYEILFVSDLTKVVKLTTDTPEPPDLIIYTDDSEEISPEDLMNIYPAIKNNIPLILISDRNNLVMAQKLLNSGIVKQQLTRPVSLREIHNAIESSLI
jgi:two-component system, cell cycle sensor histidine kinase and response regulator CckA